MGSAVSYEGLIVGYSPVDFGGEMGRTFPVLN